MTILLSDPRVRAVALGSGELMLEVDLSAVAANTATIAARTIGRLMAVVKADGFGHGAVEVARTALAHGATSLGVTALTEAWPLRDAGLAVPLLSWLNPVDADFASAVARRVDVAVPGLEHLGAVVAAVTATGRARVHLHLDAGMARDGESPADWPRLCAAARMAEQRGAIEVVGIMGHLGCADVPADPSNSLGRTRFAWAIEVARACGLRPRHRHLAATAATLTDPLSHHTMSRVGAGLVGIDPSRTTSLRPAMTLVAPLVTVRRVRAGTPVGYGHSHVTGSPTYLGLVPLGYADGLPRAASGRAEVQVRGRRVPVVGRISMDQTVVDLGASGAEVGDSVTVFGPGDLGEPTVADWASWSDTLEHEIVTGIGARVPRRTRPAAHLRSLR
jgi:alanine racemase